MRVVLDTNIIISGLNFAGREREVLDLARIGRYELCLSRFILDEVAGVLVRKFGWGVERAQRAVGLLRSWANEAEPRTRVSVIQRKDADNRILECAVEAQADYLVTGDRRDLLPLKKYKGTKVVTSAQFLAIVAA